MQEAYRTNFMPSCPADALRQETTDFTGESEGAGRTRTQDRTAPNRILRHTFHNGPDNAREKPPSQNATCRSLRRPSLARKGK